MATPYRRQYSASFAAVWEPVVEGSLSRQGFLGPSGSWHVLSHLVLLVCRSTEVHQRCSASLLALVAHPPLVKWEPVVEEESPVSCCSCLAPLRRPRCSVLALVLPTTAVLRGRLSHISTRCSPLWRCGSQWWRSP